MFRKVHERKGPVDLILVMGKLVEPFFCRWDAVQQAEMTESEAMNSERDQIGQRSERGALRAPPLQQIHEIRNQKSPGPQNLLHNDEFKISNPHIHVFFSIPSPISSCAESFPSSLFRTHIQHRRWFPAHTIRTPITYIEPRSNNEIKPHTHRN